MAQPTSEETKQFWRDNILNQRNSNLSITSWCSQNETAVLYLEEQLAWFKRQICGKRSERMVSDLNSQSLYFGGFENPSGKKEQSGS